MKIKDERFSKILIPSDKKPRNKIVSYLSNLKSKINSFNIKNQEKNTSEPILLRCDFCQRFKLFPCKGINHMKLNEGLCPDKICAQTFIELTHDNLELESYPDYRA